jgi:hypothetical protein
MDDDKKKLLGLMRFWLFGTFIIVFASTVIYIGMFTGRDFMTALGASAPIWGITAVLCVIWYFAYQWYLNRQ